MSENHTRLPCSFIRRLAAMLYDSVLLCSIFFCGTFILIFSIGEGEVQSGNLFYSGFLILLAYIYFCWHWTQGRQTLGMRSWHVFIINESNKNLSGKQASLRYTAALLSLAIIGLGFVWALFDKRKLALHDRLSKTKLIVDKETK